MPKFLIMGRYSAEGMKGLQKDKASGRQTAITAAIEAAGGSLESVHYALGEEDVYLIVDMPGAAQVAALLVTAGASGAVSTRTVPLLTVAEMDAVLGSAASYRPPGG